MSIQQTIVVGVDGSEHSRHAARFAIAEAARRGAQVVGVRAFELPDRGALPEGYEVVLRPSPSEITAAVEARTRGMLRAVAEELGGAAVSVPIDAIAILGSPAEVLVNRARDADLLVVGHRGRGAVASLTLGSVGLACVLHATCPVTVVPAAPAVERVVEPVGNAAPGRA